MMTMVAIPVEPEDLGRFWAQVNLPAYIAVRWADKYLDPQTADEVLDAFEAERLRMALAG